MYKHNYNYVHAIYYRIDECLQTDVCFQTDPLSSVR